MIEAAEIKTHPRRHVLTQFIGIPRDEMIVEPAIAEPIELEHGDVLLLCSDGLTDMLSDEELYRELGRHKSAEEKARALVEKALAAGGRDNISVIVVLPAHSGAAGLLEKALGRAAGALKKCVMRGTDR